MTRPVTTTCRMAGGSGVRVGRSGLGRRGMTIVELMVAMTVFGIVISVALTFMAQQNTAFQASLERLGALRNGRYALTTLVQDLETLGTNVPGHQPPLLYGDDDVVVFSADYATNVVGDPFAVFVDPDAPSAEVRAPSSAFTIPTTAVTAADSFYVVGAGVSSPAEILTFFFMPDSSTAAADDFVLYRQVNAATREVVARHLRRDGNEPFFAFDRAREEVGGIALSTVPDSLLPIRHVEPFHGAEADTGAVALADSVRAVTVTLVATNGLTGAEERSIRIQRSIALPNAGRSSLNTCGGSPLFGDSLVATTTTLAGGESAVDLAWGRATDETGGEEDVVRYVLWRREGGSAEWGAPFVAVPAGAASYSYQDATVEPATIYEFAVAAQDCTPALSALVSSGLVVVP